MLNYFIALSNFTLWSASPRTRVRILPQLINILPLRNETKLKSLQEIVVT